MRPIMPPDVGSYSYAGTGYANPDAVTQIANGVSSTTYAYDKNGNITQVGTTTSYTYDYQNRLTQSAIGNGISTTTTTYAYGPFGERVSQTTGSSTTIYPSKFYSVITLATGTTTTSATSTDYVYAGPNLFATIDQKLVNGTATGTPITRYNHTDNLGSTNVTSDASMNVAQWFDYAPYGSVLATTNTGQTSAGRQFEGLFNDATNLVYSNARYLNPAQGQFTSQDPVFWEVGISKDGKNALLNPQAMNSYAYAADNPIINKDPSGRCFDPFSAVACAFVVYSAATIAIDVYDSYNMNVKYGNVVPQEEKNQTNSKLGYDALLTATGFRIEETVGEAAGVAFDSLTSSLDALDTYFSEQIYKNVNDQHDSNRKKSVGGGSNIPTPAPVVIGPSNTYTSALSGGSGSGKTSQQGNGSPSTVSANSGGYSNGSGGSAYNQLVASLSQLVAALSAYVSTLSASKPR